MFAVAQCPEPGPLGLEGRGNGGDEKQHPRKNLPWLEKFRPNQNFFMCVTQTDFSFSES